MTPRSAHTSTADRQHNPLQSKVRIVADAEIKGAADDAEFALERVVLSVSRTRRR